MKRMSGSSSSSTYVSSPPSTYVSSPHLHMYLLPIYICLFSPIYICIFSPSTYVSSPPSTYVSSPPSTYVSSSSTYVSSPHLHMSLLPHLPPSHYLYPSPSTNNPNNRCRVHHFRVPARSRRRSRRCRRRCSRSNLERIRRPASANTVPLMGPKSPDISCCSARGIANSRA